MASQPSLSEDDDRYQPDERTDTDPSAEKPLPPGPDGLPLVGNTHQLIRDPFGFYDTFGQYDGVVRYEVARRHFVALLEPEHIERVLVEESDRFERFLFADQGLDFAPEGLLFTDGEQWRRQRQLMQSAFTMDRIESYADTMASAAEGLVDQWSDGQAVALKPELSDLTLQVLSKALFDIDVDPAADDEAVTRVAQMINERGDTRSVSTFLPGWVPTPANRQYKRAMRRYRERVDELIDQRRADDRTGEDLLSLLLTAGEDGEGLSEREIRDNLITFMFAGHETSSLALTYTFMLLAQDDEATAKLRDELDSVVDGERPRFADISKLDYTDAVLREAMRRYPPAYIMFRRATEDAVIGGYRIPEGTILTLPQFRLHADERFYDDLETFRPERWLGDADSDRPEYAYFPFGGGPRHCIGMGFAMLEMKLVVATLVQQFDVTLLSDPEPERTAGATLQPEEDVRVRLHER